MVKKSTNLQMMRFLAAALVIFSHSFALTQGNGEREWLYVITNGQFDLGAVAVAIFFLCGGYLAARGMEKYPGFVKYILMRFARIIPALMFVVVCCIIVGAFITTLSVGEYLSDSMTYRYFLNSFMILQHELPGVFEEAKYVPTVNGSLWTLPVEFVCNFACCIAYELGLLKKEKFGWTIPLVALGCITIYVVGSRIMVLRAMIRPCLLFYVGIMYWIYHDKIQFKMKWALAALLLLPICSIVGVFNLGMVLFFPYAMMTFWFGSTQYFEKASKLGDYSYAMYLWGFPVQQFVGERFSWNLSPYTNVVISIPVAFVLAVITYHLVEIPMGKMCKEKVSKMSFGRANR